MSKTKINDDDFQRYNRQMALDAWGEEGQIRLQQAKVLIVGCGGLGTTAGLFLAGAGVGHLVLADGDQLEVSNLSRQIAYRAADLGEAKAIALSKQLQALNPNIHIRPVNRHLMGPALSIEIALADLVLDCSDNFKTRQAINQTCRTQKTPLILAAAAGWSGHWMAFHFKKNANPCYHCLFQIKDDSIGNCQTLGVAGPVVGAVASMQALAAIQYLLGDHQIFNTLHVFEGQTHQWQTLKSSAGLQCQECARFKEKYHEDLAE